MRVKPIVLLIIMIFSFGAALLAAVQVSPAQPIKIKVTAEQANLREKPDIGSTIVQQIREGTVLEADREEGEWFFVRYTLEDGGVIGGFIHESLVEVIEKGVPVPKPQAEEEEAPTQERDSRPVRTGKVRLADLATGSVPLEFSFSAGLGSIAPRDLNAGTQGYADWNGAALGIPAPGSANLLHFAFLFGFELSYRVSSRLAIGLGADHLRGANRGELEYTDELITETLVTKPSARGVPVKLTARYYPGAGFYVRGGLGIYSVKAGYFYRLERDGAWQQWKGEATGNGLGAEAALGGEWEVAPKTCFFAEAGFRIARFRGLTGKNVYSNSDGAAQTEPGTLYFFHKIAADTNTYPLLFVSGTAPADAVDYRRADVNLSGTAVRVGLRYRF